MDVGGEVSSFVLGPTGLGRNARIGDQEFEIKIKGAADLRDFEAFHRLIWIVLGVG